jgi:predicted ATPase
MLTHLTVERFKSLVELRIDLGRVNLFIGANGSGKSNILEALGVLGAAASGRVDDESLSRRGVRPGTEQFYKSAFPELSNVPHIKVSAQTARSEFDVTLWNPTGKPGAPWGFKSEHLLRDGDKIVGRSPESGNAPNPEQGLAALKTVELTEGDPALLLMDSLRGYAIHDPNTPALRGLIPNSRDPVGLDGSGLAEAIRELRDVESPAVRTAFTKARDLIDWASDFDAVVTEGVSPSVAELQFEDRFMAAGRNRLTARDASEGALYVLFCLVLAVHPGAPSCLALDNLGQALNPRLATRLMSCICDWLDAMTDRQWILTAHNPAVLDGLALHDPSVRLFAVDRSSRGHTVVRRIDLEDALKKRPGPDWTLSRMWMTGYLGAVPNV